MKYPSEFSSKSVAAIEAEMIRARRKHFKAKQEWNSDWPFDAGSSAQTWILSVFLTYARQAIAVGAADVWPVDNVRAMAAEGLRLICIEIAHTAGLEYWVRWGGDIAPGVMSEIEASPEWRQFEDELLALAASKAGGAQTADKRDSSLAAGPTGNIEKSPGTKAAFDGQDLRRKDAKEATQRERAADIDKALAVLKSHPKYPHAAIQIIEESTKITDKLSDEARYPRNETRLGALLNLFDVWSNAALQLVTSAEMLDAYQVLVNKKAIWCWEEYTGHSFEEQPPAGPLESEWIPIRDKAVKWETQGFKALIRVQTAATEARETGDAPAAVVQTTIGRNIDRLRKECGWSFDELAGTTGLDKKLILGHVNEGKGTRPRTLKTYADAFARGLGRPVTVAEIES